MENKLPVRFKNLTLDLEHPESGIEAIKNLTKIYEKEKEEYKKTLFNWTEQEIEDAKLIAIDRMNMLCRRGVSIVWYCNKVHGITMLSTNFGTVEGVECGCEPYHGRDVRTEVHGKDIYIILGLVNVFVFVSSLMNRSLNLSLTRIAPQTLKCL